MKEKGVAKKQKKYSLTRQQRLSGFAATCRKQQRTIRRGLKFSNDLRTGADELLNMLPKGSKQAIAHVQFEIAFASLCQYILVLSYDLGCLVEEMICTRSRWKKKLFARLIALTMYECSNDFAFLIGKPLKEQLANLNLTYLDRDRKAIHKEIVEFNRYHNVLLKSIRNSAIGHRDHDGKTQLDIIRSLRPVQMYRVLRKYYGWNRKLWQLLLFPIMKDLHSIVATANKELRIRGHSSKS